MPSWIAKLSGPRTWLAGAALLVACQSTPPTTSKDGAGPATQSSPSSPDLVSTAAVLHASPPIPTSPPRAREQLDGRSFPERVLALTWDDGPDVNTLALADYLASLRVSATFFVVNEWVAGTSEEPGEGPHKLETGYSHIPILGELVARGHRLGNHTLNHVLLTSTDAGVVDFQLRENQKRIDPFLTNELRIFRVPGGAWDPVRGGALLRDSGLDDLVGPIRWDIDRKDWEGSLYCRSDRPSDQCEPGGPGREPRVRAEITAARYLRTIYETRRGIVLFHDRVGDVGSDYALRVAKRVVPQLVREGFIFAAPVLELSPFRSRSAAPQTMAWVASLDPATIELYDADGDGRADLCGTGPSGFGCARAFERATSERDTLPLTLFAPPVAASPRDAGARRADAKRALEGDLNGDGVLDECHVDGSGLRCALGSRGHEGLLTDSLWLPRERRDATPWLSGRLFLADVNGDGRADLCSVTNADVACALAP